MDKPALRFAVERWCSWRPTDDLISECSGCVRGEYFNYEAGKPDVSAVPMMQRRRLGKMARAAFHVLHQCAEPSQQEPLIFSSKMGEIQRTQNILESIASEQTVSPASFSLSVHNAIGGLWSLIHCIEAPVLALAPQDCSPAPAIFEAAGLLTEGPYAAVNIVYIEENYPSFYAPWFDSPPAPLALGLRLVRPDNNPASGAIHFDLYQVEPGGPRVSWRTISNFTDLLSGHRAELAFSEATCGWKLAKAT